MDKRNHKITLKDKVGYESNYSQNREVSEKHPLLFRFDVEQVKELVNLEGATEFVVTNGMDEKGKENRILTVKDADGKDMEFALELGIPCPPEC